MAIHPYVVDREKCNLWTKESSLLMRSFAMEGSMGPSIYYVIRIGVRRETLPPPSPRLCNIAMNWGNLPPSHYM